MPGEKLMPGSPGVPGRGRQGSLHLAWFDGCLAVSLLVELTFFCPRSRSVFPYQGQG